MRIYGSGSHKKPAGKISKIDNYPVSENPGKRYFSGKKRNLKRQFPVNNSLPARSTMVRPPGKMQAPRSFPIAAGCTPTAAVVAPTPPSAMNTPAITASRNIYGMAVLTLLFPIET